MTVELSLIVDDAHLPTDYFVAEFIDHVVSGMVEALEGTSQAKDLDLTIDGEKVTINLNGSPIPTNTFVRKIVSGTIIGMVRTLKGVDDFAKLRIVIHK